MLFENVQLQPTLKYVEGLEKGNLDRIAPHVSHVTFIPPLQSSALAYEDFSEIISILYRRKIRPGGREEQLPVPDDKARLAFQKYHQHVQKNQDLLGSSLLRQVWVQTLRKCGHYLRLSFEDADWKESFIRDVAQSGGIPGPYDHVCLRHAKESHAAALGSLLFRSAVQCLAEAGTSIRSLDIKFHIAYRDVWGQLPQWSQLDCSQLQDFTFEPSDFYCESPEDVHARLLVTNPTAVLRKCHTTLEVFKYRLDIDTGNWIQPAWPESEVALLPKLKYLDMDGICVDPRALARWIGQMPCLDHVRISEMVLDDDYPTWQFIYDAIRDHPNDVLVDFVSIETNIITGVYGLSFRKSEVDECLEDIKRTRTCFHHEACVCLYIAGRIGWDNNMAGIHSY